ncbi:MAG: ATP-binding protein [Gemmatimonadaceae bacterium]|nr:ATP-binding protein [Gemmatimonadaceae bacterium]
MIDGDILRQLFRSFADHDDSAFKAAALTLIREERGKNHRLLADDLEKLLFTRNGKPATQKKPNSEVPRDRERDFPLIDLSYPEIGWERLVIKEATFRVLQRVAEENRRRETLLTAGLQPSQRLLFYGPPGSGKTLAAGVLASVLNRPLVTVRFDAVVSSYLGETAANLRRVFDFVALNTYVVLFDEFDALGKDRDNAFEHGELKRVVNSLLQLLDAAKGQSVLVAATNHEGLLDSAIWRRFDSIIRFDVPSGQERVLMLRSFLRGFLSVDLRLDLLARGLERATGADIERVCIAAARNAILESRNKVERSDFEMPLAEFRERLPLQKTGRARSIIRPATRRKQ